MEALSAPGKIAHMLIVGVRSFRGRTIPFRSKFGNEITRKVMRIVLGRDLSDTQSGLRAIPRGLMERCWRFQLGSGGDPMLKTSRMEAGRLRPVMVSDCAGPDRHFSPGRN